jgi:hypothetical protein
MSVVGPFCKWLAAYADHPNFAVRRAKVAGRCPGACIYSVSML